MFHKPHGIIYTTKHVYTVCKEHVYTRCNYVQLCVYTSLPSQPLSSIFNPWHSCTERVTVVAMCLCVCVCLSVTTLAAIVFQTDHTYSYVIGFSRISACEIFEKGFCSKDMACKSYNQAKKFQFTPNSICTLSSTKKYWQLLEQQLSSQALPKTLPTDAYAFKKQKKKKAYSLHPFMHIRFSVRASDLKYTTRKKSIPL